MQSRIHTLFDTPASAETETKIIPPATSTPSPAKTPNPRTPFDLRALQQDPEVAKRRQQKKLESSDTETSVFQKDTTQHGALVIAEGITSDKGSIDARAIGRNPGRYIADINAPKGNLLAAVVDPITLHHQAVTTTAAKRSAAHTAVGEMINVRAGGVVYAPVKGANPISRAKQVHGGRGVNISATDPTTASSPQSLQKILDETGGSASPSPFR